MINKLRKKLEIQIESIKKDNVIDESIYLDIFNKFTSEVIYFGMYINKIGLTFDNSLIYHLTKQNGDKVNLEIFNDDTYYMVYSVYSNGKLTERDSSDNIIKIKNKLKNNVH